MFEINDYIVYGSSGVCRITNICKSPFDSSDDRDYYELDPFYNNGNSVIYTPVDNVRVRMRPLMTKDEADELLHQMPQLQALQIPVEKQRRDIYKEAVLTIDPVEYVRLIKTIYLRRQVFLAGRKRLPEIDNEYDTIARRSLYAELSLVLQVPDAEMEQYIVAVVETGKAPEPEQELGEELEQGQAQKLGFPIGTEVTARGE